MPNRLRPCAGILIALFVFLAGPAAALAAKRVALVIGNDNYDNVATLQKAGNDATAVADTLKGLGYEVILARDVTRRQMNRELQQFESLLRSGDEALFYYAGHGVEIDGRNYLLPTDIPKADAGQEEFIISEAILVDTVLDRIRRRNTKLAVLILDACRDNPFPRSGTRSLGAKRGLAGTAAPEGTFIMYSAGVGQTALDRLSNDDPDPNSVFTRSLIPLLKTPGLSLTRTAREVRRNVQELASAVSHDQRPAYYDEVTGDFFFAGPGESEANSAPAAADPGAQAWAAIQNTGSAAMLKSFISHFPDSVYADFARVRLKELEAARLASLDRPEPGVRADDSNVGQEHGWLGVQIQPVTAELGKSIGYEGTKGALVASTNDGGPAQMAGLVSGDIIVSINDEQIETPVGLAKMVASLPPGTEVKFHVWNATKNGKSLGKLDLGNLSPEMKKFFQQFNGGNGKLRVVLVRLGTKLVEPTSAGESSEGERINLSGTGIELKPTQTGEGVLIASIAKGSEAENKGLKAGDIINAVDTQDVHSPSDVRTALDEAKKHGRRAILLMISHDNQPRFLALSIE